MGLRSSGEDGGVLGASGGVEHHVHEVVGLDREHLPDFHRGAAQGREFVEEARSRGAATLVPGDEFEAMAVLTAMPTPAEGDTSTLAWTIALTSVGLVLAHQVAFRMSSRLITQGSRLEPLAPRLLRAQLLGGAVSLVAVFLPILLMGGVVGRIFNARKPDRYPAAVLFAADEQDVVEGEGFLQESHGL